MENEEISSLRLPISNPNLHRHLKSMNMSFRRVVKVAPAHESDYIVAWRNFFCLQAIQMFSRRKLVYPVVFLEEKQFIKMNIVSAVDSTATMILC